VKPNLPILIITLILGLLGLGLLVYNTLLPLWMDILLAFVVVGLVVLNGHRRKGIAWGSRSLLALIVGALFVSQWVAMQLFESKKEITIVSVYALNDYPADRLEDVYFAKAMVLSTFTEEVKERVAEHVHGVAENIELSEADDELLAVQALYDQTIDLVILDQSAVAYLQENDPQFESITKQIAELSLETEVEVLVKPVNTATTPFIVLINGRDTPAGTSQELTETNVNTNNDINLILVVNPITTTMTMLTLPRDSYVAIACKDGAMDKLTHVGRYGTQCTIDTVEALLGITINYSVKLNFPGFMNLIEVIGDITVDNQYAFTTAKNKVHFPQGTITLNPQQALEFVRERKTLPGGDFQRIRNQHEVVKGILNNLVSVNSVVGYAEILKIISGSILTNLTLQDLSPLIQKQVAQGIQWELNTLTVSGKNQYNTTYTYKSLRLFTYVLDPNSVQQAATALLEAQKAR
jgi:polyisoprenyl-teichoic acid--peptidoglycan teichoic acid transferase